MKWLFSLELGAGISPFRKQLYHLGLGTRGHLKDPRGPGSCPDPLTCPTGCRLWNSVFWAGSISQVERFPWLPNCPILEPAFLLCWAGGEVARPVSHGGGGSRAVSCELRFGWAGLLAFKAGWPHHFRAWCKIKTQAFGLQVSRVTFRG